MKTVNIPQGIERVTVEKAFQLMLDQAKWGRICISLNHQRKVISHTKGGLVLIGELQNHFLDFCRHNKVTPVSPDAPWRFDYTGLYQQNRRYEISVDEFRAFAHPYGFEISRTGTVAMNATDEEMPADGETPELASDIDLLKDSLILVDQNKRVANGSEESPKKKRSLRKTGKHVVAASIRPGPGVSFANADLSSLVDTVESDWGDEPPSSDASVKDTFSGSKKLPGRSSSPKKGLRGAINHVTKRELLLNDTETSRTEAVVEQPRSALPVTDYDMQLANLFDAVKVAQLGKMFPDEDKKGNSKWVRWAERAARNGLKVAAKVDRALFNPYHAAKWWIKQGPKGWDWARCVRVLSNNLPARSRDSASELTGNFD